MISWNGCDITKSRSQKGLWILGHDGFLSQSLLRGPENMHSKKSRIPSENTKSDLNSTSYTLRASEPEDPFWANERKKRLKNALQTLRAQDTARQHQMYVPEVPGREKQECGGQNKWQLHTPQTWQKALSWQIQETQWTSHWINMQKATTKHATIKLRQNTDKERSHIFFHRESSSNDCKFLIQKHTGQKKVGHFKSAEKIL